MYQFNNDAQQWNIVINCISLRYTKISYLTEPKDNSWFQVM